jgi:hypothetical protein
VWKFIAGVLGSALLTLIIAYPRDSVSRSDFEQFKHEERAQFDQSQRDQAAKDADLTTYRADRGTPGRGRASWRRALTDRTCAAGIGARDGSRDVPARRYRVGTPFFRIPVTRKPARLGGCMLYLLAFVFGIQLWTLYRLEKLMSSQNQGLVSLQADMVKLQAANTQILADVTKLLAGQQPGLQPGQVIVNQSDIDALDSTVQSMTGSDTAEDAVVNPPAATSPTSAVKKS